MNAFARGNYARLHRLEVSDATATEWLEALEQQVFQLEKKLLGAA